MTIGARWAELWDPDDPLDSLWRLFASPYLTMLLLTCLAVLIGLGIILPQRPTEALTDQAANNLWLASLRERYHGLVDWLARLKLLDIYRSLWLRGLLGLLAFNLLLAAVDLIHPRHAWHAGVEHELFVHDPALVESPKQLLDRLQRVLCSQGYRFLIGKDNGLACVDHSWAFPLLVYVGLLLVIAGLAISERSAWWENNVALQPGQVRPLGHGTNLAVRADKIETYGGRAELTLLRGDSRTAQRTLHTTAPSVYDGLLFYLTSTEPVLLIQVQDASGRNLPLRTPETGGTQFMEVALHFREAETPRYIVVLDLLPGSQLSRQFQQSGLERYVLVPARDLSLRLRYNPSRSGEVPPTFQVEAFRGTEALPFYQHQFHAAETIEIAGDRYYFQPQRYAVIKFGQDYGLVLILPGMVLTLAGIILSVKYPLRRVYLTMQPISGAMKIVLTANAPATESPLWLEKLLQDIATVAENAPQSNKRPLTMDKKA
ncbi:MAG: cytochrome c biogenesis protein ResB [Chloroflexi bacterium]|nr:cytochrome c biogenesis protein ResB [Chloroflexota bacterium]